MVPIELQQLFFQVVLTKIAERKYCRKTEQGFLTVAVIKKAGGVFITTKILPFKYFNRFF